MYHVRNRDRDRVIDGLRSMELSGGTDNLRGIRFLVRFLPPFVCLG